MRRTGLAFCMLFLISLGFVKAQPDTDFHEEIRFVQHLLGRQSYSEAMFLLESLQTSGQGQADTLNYLTGWVLYGRKDLQASAFYLTKVSRQSVWYDKSSFFAAYNNTYQGHFPDARALLSRFNAHDEFSEVTRAMQNFQFAGIALLERNTEQFDRHAAVFSGVYPMLAEEEQKLLDYRMRLQQAPGKSPLLAGLMSAAVPGLGKIYAGKSAEGISGLLYVGAMAATSWDFYNRLGPKNPFFILSAALTSVFYVGNIWGSVVAVNRVRNEFDYEMDQRILLDLHIPLRKLYP